MTKFICFLLLYSSMMYSQFDNGTLISSNAINARFVKIADVDGDGFHDVLVASPGNDSLEWYKNIDGLGTFGTKQVIHQGIYEYRFIATADIDNDGDLDILTTALFDNLVIWFENLDGLGSFSTTKIIDTSLDRPNTVVAGDIDLDGDLDIVCSSRLDGKITWYNNSDGLGNFILGQTITNNAVVPISADLADFDDDGDLDLISNSSSYNNQPAWFENLDGNGAFGVEQVITNLNSGSLWVETGDIDNDSFIDIVTLEFGGETIAWFKNEDGLGNFGEKRIITTQVDAPYQVIMADIDNDGFIDAVYVSGGNSTIAWQRNDGFGNFGEQQIITHDLYLPKTVDVGDIDNDGFLDVVSASMADYTVKWYKNLTYLNTQENLLLQLSLTPNPTTGILNLQTPNSTIENITVYDVLGKPVLQQNNNLTTIDLSHLQNGMYLVKVTGNNGGTVVKKVVLSR